MKGGVQLGWGKLTDDHLAAMAGRREICAGRLQAAYGIGKAAAGRLAGATVKTIREVAKISEVANDDATGLHRIDARQ